MIILCHKIQMPFDCLLKYKTYFFNLKEWFFNECQTEAIE